MLPSWRHVRAGPLAHPEERENLQNVKCSTAHSSRAQTAGWGTILGRPSTLGPHEECGTQEVIPGMFLHSLRASRKSRKSSLQAENRGEDSRRNSVPLSNEK